MHLLEKNITRLLSLYAQRKKEGLFVILFLFGVAQYVDKIVEVPRYAIKEKIIEVPKVLVIERIIPILRSYRKEQVVYVEPGAQVNPKPRTLVFFSADFLRDQCCIAHRVLLLRSYGVYRHRSVACGLA